MSRHFSRHCCAVFTLAVLITGCDSSGSEPSASPIALNGPLSAALATADQLPPSTTGTRGITEMLSGFPSAALTDFSTRFPGSTAEEQFRTVSYNSGVVVSEVFGIEGGNVSNTVEVSALYSADGTFLSSASQMDNATLPISVTNTVNSLYPNATIGETEQRQDENGVLTYSVELALPQAELDLVLDSAGALIETSEEITAVQVPAAVAAEVQQELTGGEEVEYEQVTDTQTGTVMIEAELEHDVESVELAFTDAGQILSMTFERDI